MPVTIVTGGTFGLGLAITLELARRGHQVVAIGLSRPQVSSTAEGTEGLRLALGGAGLDAEIIEADVSSATDVECAIANTIKRFGRIDGVVNNAAIGPLGTILDTDEALFDRILAVNLKGTYLVSRAALPHMIRNNGGGIVNVGSGAGWGKPNMAAYAASKGAIVALSMAMAYDHFHDHVRVNVVIPGGGGIISGMSVGRMHGDVDAFRKKVAPGTAAGRSVSGQDLANAVAFLLSEEAVTISGTVMDIGCFAHQGGPVPLK